MKLYKGVIALAIAATVGFSLLPAEEVTGKDIFLNNKCNTCHSIKSQGIESKVGEGKYPDLSNVASNKFENDFIKKFLMKEETLDGKKHAIKFKGDDAELSKLVDWLQTLKQD